MQTAMQTSGPESFRPKRPRPKGGRLVLVVGPMYAGKTSELGRRVRRWERGGLRVLCVKPVSDTRYQEDQGAAAKGPRIVTHDRLPGRDLEASAVPSLSSIPLLDAHDCVAVDEAQFFDGDDLRHEVERWLRADLRVVVSGLDGTYQARPFPGGGPPLNLASLADRVIKLHAVCDQCGSGQATQSHRIVAPSADGDVIMVGGSESYRALCRACYFEATPPPRVSSDE